MSLQHLFYQRTVLGYRVEERQIKNYRYFLNDYWSGVKTEKKMKPLFYEMQCRDLTGRRIGGSESPLYKGRGSVHFK